MCGCDVGICDEQVQFWDKQETLDPTFNST